MEQFEKVEKLAMSTVTGSMKIGKFENLEKS